MSRRIPKDNAYFDVGTNGTVLVKLPKRKYSGSLATLIGAQFQDDPPAGKTVIRARSTSEARIDGKLVQIILIYRNGTQNQQTKVLCSPKRADDALDNQALALRQEKWEGKDIVDAYPA